MKRLLPLLLLLPLCTIAQKKGRKAKEPEILQPVVSASVDQITLDTAFYTNIYRFAPDASFNISQSKKGVFLKITFDAYLEPVGNPLFIRFTDDHVLTMQPVQMIRPMHVAGSWMSTAAFQLDEGMVKELLTNDIKFIRMQSSSGNYDYAIEDRHKDAIKRFLTAINNR